MIKSPGGESAHLQREENSSTRFAQENVLSSVDVSITRLVYYARNGAVPRRNVRNPSNLAGFVNLHLFLLIIAQLLLPHPLPLPIGENSFRFG